MHVVKAISKFCAAYMSMHDRLHNIKLFHISAYICIQHLNARTSHTEWPKSLHTLKQAQVINLREISKMFQQSHIICIYLILHKMIYKFNDVIMWSRFI